MKLLGQLNDAALVLVLVLALALALALVQSLALALALATVPNFDVGSDDGLLFVARFLYKLQKLS